MLENRNCNCVTGSAHTCRIVLRSVLCLFYDFNCFILQISSTCWHWPETGATVPGPGRHRPPGWGASWQIRWWWWWWEITEITSRVISSTGRSRLMPPHLTPLSPWLRWKLPWAWRHKSGLRVEGARHAVTRYFCVSGDQCSVTSCAPLLWSLIMTITSGEHSSPGPLSAADIFDFLRNNIWSSISFPLKIKSFGWMITKRVRYHCIGIVRVSTDFTLRIWFTNFLFCMTSAVTIHERRPSQFIIYHSWEQPFKRHETLQCHYLTLASWFVSLFFFLCSKQLWPERRRER